MKLIELSEEQYVLVDEVKEIKPSSPSNGHWCYVLHKPSNTILEVNLIGEQMGNMTVIDETPRNKREVLYKEVVPIIAASATIEFHPIESVKLIPLSEVEEAIYGYSVEKMANENRFEKLGDFGNSVKILYRNAFSEGFNAHKELVKYKFFTIEDMEDIFNSGIKYGKEHGETKEECFQREIKPLLPKAEWEVEFDEQGKLKLI